MQTQVDSQALPADEYICTYEPTTQTIVLAGMLRLDGVSGYAPIAEFLDTVAAQRPTLLTLDIQRLEYLNSSGIATLARFVLGLHRQGDTHLVIKASQQMPWQERSMKNLIRLMPDAQLEFI